MGTKSKITTPKSVPSKSLCLGTDHGRPKKGRLSGMTAGWRLYHGWQKESEEKDFIDMKKLLREGN